MQNGKPASHTERWEVPPWTWLMFLADQNDLTTPLRRTNAQGFSWFLEFAKIAPKKPSNNKCLQKRKKAAFFTNLRKHLDQSEIRSNPSNFGVAASNLTSVPRQKRTPRPEGWSGGSRTGNLLEGISYPDRLILRPRFPAVRASSSLFSLATSCLGNSWDSPQT